MSILRMFCEGSRSEPHERTAMVRAPHHRVNTCQVEGCQNSITDEQAQHAIPTAYLPLINDEFGTRLADIGAIDVIAVGLWDLRVEYPRRNQV